MSSQAKKNRRNMSTNIEPSSIIKPAMQTADAQTNASSSSNRNVSRKGATESPRYPYLMKDLLWTGIVSTFVIILLIVSYIIFG
jgi:hypothetical protein